MQIDVFNGDADGICALIQLRLAQPVESLLITGVKRDIELLKQVQAKSGDYVTVLDISLQKNHKELERILNAGAEVFYIDHHQVGDIPKHAALNTLIDTDINVCTSLLVNQHLKGQFKTWAIVAAFGDSMDKSASQVAKDLKLKQEQLIQLKNLGICINYNGYGSCVEELHFTPDALYRELSNYASPFEFMSDNVHIYQKLLAGYQDDMDNALKTLPEYANEHIAIYILPDVAWARRISGVFGNALAKQYPNRAHAILSHNTGGYLVSVRSALLNQTRADEFCASFPSGGGRKSAAGINHLPTEQLGEFIQRFSKNFSSSQ